MGQVGVIGLVVIVVLVALVLALPTIQNLINTQAWVKVSLARERTTQLQMFFLVVGGLVFVSLAGGFLAFLSHQKHQENMALLASEAHYPQLERPRIINIYVAPGERRYPRYTEYLMRGLITGADDVRFIEEEDPEKCGEMVVACDN